MHAAGALLRSDSIVSVMITRNAICPYGCGAKLWRTEDRGKVTYSERNGKKHTCPEQFQEQNTVRGYVSDGGGCVERIW